MTAFFLALFATLWQMRKIEAVKLLHSLEIATSLTKLKPVM